METIVSFFLNLIEWVKYLVIVSIQLLINSFCAIIDLILVPLVEILPDLSSNWDSFSQISSYFHFASYFVNFRLAFLLISTYLIFLTAMILIKLTIKLFIPTVG